MEELPTPHPVEVSIQDLQARIPQKLVAVTCVLMTLHGGNMRVGPWGSYQFRFPSGTQKYPQAAEHHWKVVFPDGFEVSLREKDGLVPQLFFEESAIPQDLKAFVKAHPKLQSVTDIATFTEIGSDPALRKKGVESWMILPVAIRGHVPARFSTPVQIFLSVPVGLGKHPIEVLIGRYDVKLELIV
jgi:hypothetical protein